MHWPGAKRSLAQHWSKGTTFEFGEAGEVRPALVAFSSTRVPKHLLYSSLKPARDYRIILLTDASQHDRRPARAVGENGREHECNDRRQLELPAYCLSNI